MAKSCLNRIHKNILQSCTIAPVGVKDIYLMYPEDVAFSLDGDALLVADVTFKDGAKSYRVEGYKQNIQVTTALRSLDASAKLDISISFKMPHTERTLWRSILAGRFYALIVYNPSSDNSPVVGIQSPLEVTASDFDSNAGAGLVTFTLAAPEGSAGNYFTVAVASARDKIISKSV